jgi:hypothetical protein
VSPKNYFRANIFIFKEMSKMNILLAITNIASLYPLLICYETHDFTTFVCVSFAAMSSFVSHLLMSHKHNMIGFGTNVKLSKLLDNIDILSVVVLMIRLFYLSNNTFLFDFIGYNYFNLIILAILNLLSEKIECLYMLFHNLWHIGAFLLLGEFLLFHSQKIK